MRRTVREFMTKDPIALPESATILDAARAMRDMDIGDVLVLRGEEVCGIVTDRDLVVRALAEGLAPSTELAQTCSSAPLCLSPDATEDDALRVMRERAVRRIPVVDQGRPVGILSLGDLARERDPRSVLADISAAPPND